MSNGHPLDGVRMSCPCRIEGGGNLKMLWIKSYVTTGEDPKTGKFCRRTGMNRPTAVGSLHLFWWWAVEFCKEGDITDIEPEDIADAMRFEGDCRVLFDALLESGYIEENEAGYEISGWKQIGGQIIQNREKDAVRKAEKREEEKKSKPSSTPVQKKSKGSPADIQQKSGAEIEIEKEIENKKDIKDIPPDQEKEPNPDPNQDQGQNPKSEQTAESSASPDSQTGEKPEKGSRKKVKRVYEEGNTFLKMANYLKEKIDGFAEAEGVLHLTKRSNMQTWADDFRLLVEVDGQEDKNLIRDVMDWLPKSVFWRKNVLSGSKFREKFGTLVLEMRSDKAKGGKGSGGAGGGKPHKPLIPIVSNESGKDEGPSDEEYAEMMRNAAAMQAAKEGER
ncbi:hypothetical protein BK129_01625 [Paenibacillus amylolyticus]|uniref:hypothetical protein n=1 Tax=Paenibacillus amylolyticus TaxID=1451 RepID=UPI00096E7D60|nr:hypothetical protein [Paenibacillus amylolyticus]OMF09578.1 hypothetical protein BK129_01625 [Paenibacillus amylolyticus]